MSSATPAAQLLLFQIPAQGPAPDEDGATNKPGRRKRQPQRVRKTLQAELFVPPTVQRRQPRRCAITESDGVRAMILALRRRGYRVTRVGRTKVQVDGRSYDVGLLAAALGELLEARRGRRGPRVAELERIGREDASA
ncbi:MAG: hypothetical protein KAY22_07995 [Rhizorhabdus sp.]|uniref:hypothetical protein n=1 Tax=Rhizorhabdus sp. TaxID=1968843 RepID=UPI001B6CC234|nr:hypothetical protein [Rhizorhabdus sp.]MBP8232229.1 hypothetical protein [Rhizorhabdus sp.]